MQLQTYKAHRYFTIIQYCLQGFGVKSREKKNVFLDAFFSSREKFRLFLKSCILLLVANLLSILSRVTRLCAESILKRMCKQRKKMNFGWKILLHFELLYCYSTHSFPLAFHRPSKSGSLKLSTNNLDDTCHVALNKNICCLCADVILDYRPPPPPSLVKVYPIYSSNVNVYLGEYYELTALPNSFGRTDCFPSGESIQVTDT